MIKQVIVVRKDLNMRKGKIAAQVAHASMKVFFDLRINTFLYISEGIYIPLNEEMREWVDGLFTKIVVSCNSEEELIDIYSKARNIKELPCCMIVDSGLTEFHNQPTRTVVAIGPAEEEKINAITGHLKLL